MLVLQVLRVVLGQQVQVVHQVHREVLAHQVLVEVLVLLEQVVLREVVEHQEVLEALVHQVRAVLQEVLVHQGYLVQVVVQEAQVQVEHQVLQVV